MVVENAVMAMYARSGHLLFVRDSTLFAIRFDPAALRTEGSAVPVLEDIASWPSDAEAGFAISDNGTLVVVRQSEWKLDTRLVWVDRAGKEQPAIAALGAYAAPRLSPDQRRIVLTVGPTDGNRNLWVYDVPRELLAQITRNARSASHGVWTPDGTQIVFTNETPSYDLFRVPIDGSSAPVAVVSNTKDKFAGSISPDGKTLAYAENWAGDQRIRLAPLDGSQPGRVIGDSSVHLLHPQYSPDGHWIAADGLIGANAVSHIFILRADGASGALQVSGGDVGESDPRWTRGGRELVFRRGSAVYAVDVDPATRQVGKEHKLFDGDYPQALGYDAAADGNRFLMVKVVDRPGALPILVITNFFEELRRKVGK